MGWFNYCKKVHYTFLSFSHYYIYHSSGSKFLRLVSSRTALFPFSTPSSFHDRSAIYTLLFQRLENAYTVAQGFLRELHTTTIELCEDLPEAMSSAMTNDRLSEQCDNIFSQLPLATRLYAPLWGTSEAGQAETLFISLAIPIFVSIGSTACNIPV